jgi:hypothetical protein
MITEGLLMYLAGTAVEALAAEGRPPRRPPKAAGFFLSGSRADDGLGHEPLH